MPTRLNRPLRLVVAAYVVVSGLWIWLSDHAVEALFELPQARALAQTVKGGFFVAVTALLLWLALRGLLERVRAAAQREVDALQRSARASALLRAVADGSTDTIFAKDRDGRYLLYNREAARFVGRTADGVVGLDDTALFSAPHAALLRANDQKVMQLDRAETFEEELETPLGRRTFLATKGPLHDDDGGVMGVFGISRDITEMVVTRRRLAQSELRYRQLFKASPQPLWAFDLETRRILAVNEAAEALYG